MEYEKSRENQKRFHGLKNVEYVFSPGFLFDEILRRCLKQKKAERLRTLLRRFRQEPVTTIHESLRQDVKTQSYQIQFTYSCDSKFSFYLADFRSVC